MMYIKISKCSDRDSLTIPDTLADTILEMITKNLICEKCQKTYTTDNPQTIKNICLKCMLADKKELQYIDKQIKDCGCPKAERYEYRFIDKNNYIHTSNETNETVYKSIPETLKYWKFPSLPSTYFIEKATTPDRVINGWYLTGDFKNQFIMANATVSYYTQDFSEKLIHLEYILEKNGWHGPLNKRKATTRALIKQAEEQTKEKKGNWYSLYDVSMELLELLNKRKTVEDLV